MTQRIVHKDAESDIDHILDYLEREAGSAVALKCAIEFRHALKGIADHPAHGAPRPSLGASTRILVVDP